MQTPSTPPTTPQVSAEETLALAHVRRIKAFYVHLAEYCAVIGSLAVMNLFIGPDIPWVLFAASPWGLLLALEGLRAFDKLPFLSGQWERRQVERYLGRQL